MSLKPEEITSKDFQVFAWRGLVHNGALLRTIFQCQVQIMKHLELPNQESINQRANDLLTENFKFVEEALKNCTPEYKNIDPPIKDF